MTDLKNLKEYLLHLMLFMMKTTMLIWKKSSNL